MLDLSGLSNQIPNRQRVKKKEEKKKTKEFSIKDIPPPHRIKAMLDEYVIGQDRAKKSCRLPFTTITNVSLHRRTEISRSKNPTC